MRGALSLVAALLILSACASTGGVAPMGKDAFMPGMANRVYVVSPAEMTALTAGKTTAHCTTAGKKASPPTIQNPSPDSMTDTTGTHTFQCLR